MNTQLTFKNHTLTPVIINNQPYLGYSQIGEALQYGQRGGQFDTPLRKLYERHADEFTPDMSFLTTIDTNGGKQQVRVFSLRGCHLLAMFSKTPVAKEFRRWVLDLIEQRHMAVSSLPVSLTQDDRKTIGGIVKRCVKSAVKECLGNFLSVPQAKATLPEGKEQPPEVIKMMEGIVDYGNYQFRMGQIKGIIEGVLSPEMNDIRSCLKPKKK